MLWGEGLEQFHCHCAQSYGMRVPFFLGKRIVGQFDGKNSTCGNDFCGNFENFADCNVMPPPQQQSRPLLRSSEVKRSRWQQN